MPDEAPVVIAGAGPAGLTAAYDLTKHGLSVSVFEADAVVGGISQTVERDGWRFDIGGHRFFTKVASVEALWHEILPDEDFLLRPRMSRIYYRGSLFDYPLKAVNALRGLGVWEAARCIASYAWARVRPPKDQSHFDAWLMARFGKRLFSIFFKTYTEKVWGMSASELPADWAAQRIKNLDGRDPQCVAAQAQPEGDHQPHRGVPVPEVRPRDDVGALHRARREGRRHGGAEHLGRHGVLGGGQGRGGVVGTGPDGVATRCPPRTWSPPPRSRALVRAMSPAAPDEVVAAADDLRYRDFLTVALVVPEAGFPDNWIYIHTPGVNVGRIQNFGSWSPFLVKEGRTCLGLEFFVNEGDKLWSMADEDLVRLGTAELEQLKLIEPGKVEAGYVVRMPKAYPVYDDRYLADLDVIRAWLDAKVPNVHPVGRNGMHRYNNQDHSMLTALLTAENIRTGSQHDVWSVNVEEEYHEAGGTGSGTGTGRDAPVLPWAAGGEQAGRG